jgi:hypothetical protein
MTELLCETPERASLSLLITQGCLNRSIVSEPGRLKSATNVAGIRDSEIEA